MNIMSVLWPLVALGGLGLFFGLVLAFASKKFAVETDPRVEAVREALPGANCGACGFPGCDGMASAIVEGSAPVNGCPVAGPNGAARIAGIMGTEAGAVEERAVQVLCQGTEGNTQAKYDYDGLQDCAAAALYADGQKSCRFACLGFGNCVKVCQFGAIRLEGGIARIDMQKCRACEKCVKACPKGCIRMFPKSAHVVVGCRNQDKGKDVRSVCLHGCIACRKCEKVCPARAISFADNLPIIDYDKCTSCGACIDGCPTKTLYHADSH